MVNWLGLAMPLAYLSILVGSLATFSTLYRKRKSGKSPPAPFSPLSYPTNTLTNKQKPTLPPSNPGSPPTSNATSTSPSSTSSPTPRPATRNPPPCRRASCARRCCGGPPRTSAACWPSATLSRRWPAFFRRGASATTCGRGVCWRRRRLRRRCGMW